MLVESGVVPRNRLTTTRSSVSPSHSYTLIEATANKLVLPNPDSPYMMYGLLDLKQVKGRLLQHTGDRTLNWEAAEHIYMVTQLELSKFMMSPNKPNHIASVTLPGLRLSNQ